jgi:protein phosphatase
MAELVIHIGSNSAQGVRPNNEDSLLVDNDTHLFLVADGMGGQERGEQASSMAVDIIPKVVRDRLAANEPADQALQQALAQANAAIIEAGRGQPEGRRMGTTAVLALRHQDQVYVAGLGDSRAYLIRGDRVEQLTMDHSVAAALVACGALTPEEARHSPYQHVLHKFLGCVGMQDGAEVRPFTPNSGDRLLLATDGLTNFVSDDDLRDGPASFPQPQAWADYLVKLALDRGSKDNVTCIVVVFEQA